MMTGVRIKIAGTVGVAEAKKARLVAADLAVALTKGLWVLRQF